MTTTDVPGGAPAARTPLPSMDARELRQAVDAVSSRRKTGGDPLYAVVELGASGLTMTIVAGSEDDPPANAVFKIDTAEVWAGRTAPESVTLTHDGMPTENLAQTYDAVFWSEAAVEKFVLPYYASKSLWDAAATLQELSMAWYGRVPDAGVSPDSRGSVPEQGAVIPFALGHTPDSDYSTLTDFEVLYNEQGEVRRMRVRDFVRRYRQPAAG